MSKNDYRIFFANVKKYFKLTVFCKENNISLSNFSNFMKGSEYDFLISTSKLNALYESVIKYCEKIV